MSTTPIPLPLHLTAWRPRIGDHEAPEIIALMPERGAAIAVIHGGPDGITEKEWAIARQLLKAVNEYDTLRAQNAQLLEALKGVLDLQSDLTDTSWRGAPDWQRALTLIASIKEGQ